MALSSPGLSSFCALSLTCLLVSAYSGQAHAQILTGGNSSVGLWPSLEANNEASPVEDPGPLFSAPYGHNHFFGDWWGAQPWLLDHGIHILADVHEELAGNFKGAASRVSPTPGRLGWNWMWTGAS